MIEITTEYLASQGLNETFPQRFWSKVKKTKTCWLWIGAKSSAGSGYGHIQKGGRNGGLIGAHCASWILQCGPIPERHCVLHKCPNGNSLCLNPAHLYTGTQRDNMLDAIKDGHYRSPHPFGEQAMRAKLTQAQADKIRNLRKSGRMIKSIAEKYRVDRSTIWAICTNRRYVNYSNHS